MRPTLSVHNIFNSLLFCMLHMNLNANIYKFYLNYTTFSILSLPHFKPLWGYYSSFPLVSLPPNSSFSTQCKSVAGLILFMFSYVQATPKIKQLKWNATFYPLVRGE